MTLFAALVAPGNVMPAHKRRRRRSEFLDFMNESAKNESAAAYPDTAVHAVCANCNTHKPKEDRRLKRHPAVPFHFTPTHASWLILHGGSLADASLILVKRLRDLIDAFSEA